MWDGKKGLYSKIKVRGWGCGGAMKEKEQDKSPVTAVSYDPKQREDESKTLCRVFSEALDKPRTLGKGG